MLLHCYIIPFAGKIYTTQVVPQLTTVLIFTHVGHTKKTWSHKNDKTADIDRSGQLKLEQYN